MSSWRARSVTAAVRVYIRRRRWGNEPAVARRARRVFGAMPLFRSPQILGVRAEPVRDGDVRGEWITASDSHHGTQVEASELLLDDSRRVHEKVARAGGVSRLAIFEGVFHCWQMLDRVIPEAGLALQQAADFMNDAATGRQPQS